MAGCVLGYLLRKQNKKVLIIEKKDMINKSKLCGGLLTKKSYDLLYTIYKEDIKNLDFSINNKILEFNNIIFYTIYRKELDDFVLDEYLKLNGEIIDNKIISNLDIDKNELTVENVKYKFDYLVGADGVFSQIRKTVTEKNQNMNFALESSISISNKSKLEIYFFDKIKSYGWIIPNNKYAMIGIGDVSSKIKIEDDFLKYLKLINLSIDNKRGAFLPTGNDIFLEYNKYIKFIGDAGGLISPITGEGIYYAILSAKTLSMDFNNYKNNMNHVIKQIRKENLYKKFVYNYKIRNFIFNRYSNKIFRNMIIKFANKIL